MSTLTDTKIYTESIKLEERKEALAVLVNALSEFISDTEALYKKITSYSIYKNISKDEIINRLSQ